MFQELFGKKHCTPCQQISKKFQHENHKKTWKKFKTTGCPKKTTIIFLTLDPFWYFGRVPKLSKRVHPYSTPVPVSFSLDRENILSKIPKGTCVLCLLLSLNSHQFTAWRCFVRVRIIEILLRRPQPTRNTQATLATKSQLPDPPLLHLQHAKFAFRHNSFLPTFLPKRSLLLLSEVEQHSYFGDKTQPFGPFVWTLFFFICIILSYDRKYFGRVGENIYQSRASPSQQRWPNAAPTLFEAWILFQSTLPS